MIANAMGANVVAIDITDEKLRLAEALGAVSTVNSTTVEHTVEAVREITKGGAHVSIDALGHPVTCSNSIANLRKRGKHIQIGLMLGDNRTPEIPMDLVIANELEILGSHGIQAYRYEAIWEMIKCGKLKPEQLLGKTISLEQSIDELMSMDRFEHAGVTVIDTF